MKIIGDSEEKKQVLFEIGILIHEITNDDDLSLFEKSVFLNAIREVCEDECTALKMQYDAIVKKSVDVIKLEVGGCFGTMKGD